MNYQDKKVKYHTETVSSMLLENSQTQEIILRHSITEEQHKGNQNVIEDDDVEYLHPSTKKRLDMMEKINVDEMLDRFRKQIHPLADDISTKPYLNADDILNLHKQEEPAKNQEMQVAEQISKLYTG